MAMVLGFKESDVIELPVDVNFAGDGGVIYTAVKVREMSGEDHENYITVLQKMSPETNSLAAVRRALLGFTLWFRRDVAGGGTAWDRVPEKFWLGALPSRALTDLMVVANEMHGFGKKPDAAPADAPEDPAPNPPEDPAPNPPATTPT